MHSASPAEARGYSVGLRDWLTLTSRSPSQPTLTVSPSRSSCQVSVAEFVGSEHTPKNRLITAHRQRMRGEHVPRSAERSASPQPPPNPRRRANPGPMVQERRTRGERTPSSARSSAEMAERPAFLAGRPTTPTPTPEPRARRRPRQYHALREASSIAESALGSCLASRDPTAVPARTENRL